MKVRRRCKCGCGEITTIGKLWIQWHGSKGKNNGMYRVTGKDHPSYGMRPFNYKHGFWGTRIYATWENMKTRCYNKNIRKYKDYGGRGIRVCIRWKVSAKSFCNWGMSHGYKDHLQIDRIDNNGNYTPDNCRWVTPKVNMNNRRPHYEL